MGKKSKALAQPGGNTPGSEAAPRSSHQSGGREPTSVNVSLEQLEIVEKARTSLEKEALRILTVAEKASPHLVKRWGKDNHFPRKPPGKFNPEVTNLNFLKEGRLGVRTDPYPLDECFLGTLHLVNEAFEDALLHCPVAGCEELWRERWEIVFSVHENLARRPILCLLELSYLRTLPAAVKILKKRQRLPEQLNPDRASGAPAAAGPAAAATGGAPAAAATGGPAGGGNLLEDLSAEQITSRESPPQVDATESVQDTVTDAEAVHAAAIVAHHALINARANAARDQRRFMQQEAARRESLGQPDSTQSSTTGGPADTNFSEAGEPANTYFGDTGEPTNTNFGTTGGPANTNFGTTGMPDNNEISRNSSQIRNPVNMIQTSMTIKQVSLLDTDVNHLKSFIAYVEQAYASNVTARHNWARGVQNVATRQLDRDVAFSVSVKQITPSAPDWRDWAIHEFKAHTAKIYPGVDESAGAAPTTLIRELGLGTDLHFSANIESKGLPNLRFVLNKLDAIVKKGEPSMMSSYIDDIIDQFEASVGSGPPHMRFFVNHLRASFPPGTPKSWASFELCLLQFSYNVDLHRKALTELLGWNFSHFDSLEVRGGSRKEQGLKRSREAYTDRKPATVAATTPAASSMSSRPQCNHCGQRTHDTASCHHIRGNQQGLNTNPNVLWADSAEGKKNQGRPWFSKSDKPLRAKSDAKSSSHPKKRYSSIDGYVNIIVNNNTILTPVLFDTGALGRGNYGSRALQARLEAAGARQLSAPCENEVCSVFGECKRCIAAFDVVLSVSVDGKVKEFETIVQIFDFAFFDLILSRHTLHTHLGIQLPEPERSSVIATCASTNASVLQSLLLNAGDQQNTEEQIRVPAALQTCCQCCRLAVPPPFTPFDDEHEIVSVLSSSSYTRENKDVFLTSGDGGNDLDEFDYPSAFDESLLTQNDTTARDWESITFEGSIALQLQLKALAHKNFKLFSKTLRADAASVPAYRINLKDDNNWESPRHRQASRVYSQAQREEMDRQIHIMLEAGVISPSTAGAWSHAVLAKKKNGNWRFCIDYRMLNAMSKDIGWPIPNIMETLKSIGRRRPKFFAVMDLTSGYHQMALSTSDRKYTAFMTDKGLFEFNRVPFGLKGAPSYFQHTMSQEVLKGLLGQICEVYLDDIIIFAETEEELLARLETVFERLKRKGITANPAKCHFGLSQIEYVGHLINHLGMHFTAEKLDKVLHFDQPKTQAGMKSFLGLINYFRDHVEHFAGITKPLNEMLVDYTRRKTLKWTPELEQAFELAKQSVYQCPFVYYVEDHLELYLHTDASDYAIGGYLFQLVPTGDFDEKGNPIYKERPIAFCSHILTAAQCKAWPTIEKEAYAIIYAIKKFEPYLRDRNFVLRTDHRNLTFIDKEQSARVNRWRLLLQEFSFDIEYLPGLNNVLADRLSRDVIRADLPTATVALIVAAIADPARREISIVHNDIVGHFGVDRTMQLLHGQGRSWPGMRKDVTTFVRECPFCQKAKEQPRVTNVPRYTLASSQPMQSLHVDSIGPLPKDAVGNQYILVIIDAFSRFLEMYPLSSLEAKPAVDALLKHVCRFGIPAEVRTDNGTQFKDVFHQLLVKLRVSHPTVIPHSHQENAIVERANKEVMRHLRPMILDTPTIREHWSEALPLVQRIFNSTVKESTGVAPATLIFGNAIDLNRHLLDTMPAPLTTQPLSQLEWVQRMTQLQTTIIEAAREMQSKRDQEHLFPKPKRVRFTEPTTDVDPPITEFPDGSYVLLSYPDGPFGSKPPDKLYMRLRGPYQVVRHDGSRYTIRNLTNNKTQDVFVTQLRAFTYDPATTDPRAIAMKEMAMMDIEEVLQHQGNLYGKKDQLSFLVRWRDSTDADDSWVPWKTVYRSPAAHAYLIRIGRTSMIPAEFRPQAVQAAQAAHN